MAWRTGTRPPRGTPGDREARRRGVVREWPDCPRNRGAAVAAGALKRTTDEKDIDPMTTTVADAGAPAPPPAASDERRASIAIVDDDSGFAGYLRTFLGIRGFEARSY